MTSDKPGPKSILENIFSDPYIRAYMILETFYFGVLLLMLISHLFITTNQARLENLVCDIEIYKGSVSSEECTNEFISAHVQSSQWTWNWLSTWGLVPLIGLTLILVITQLMLAWHLGRFWFDDKKGGRRKKSKGGDDNGDGFINTSGGGGSRKHEMEIVAN